MLSENNYPFDNKVNVPKTIVEGVYVYKNFIDKGYCDKITELAYLIPDRLWNERSWYRSTKKEIKDLNLIHDKIKSILKDNFFLGENLSIVKFIKGQTWDLHADNHDSIHLLQANKKIKASDVTYPAEYTTHGIIIYFNDYEGANINYPDLGIEYKPEKGDMLVHRSDILHKVSELESDIRYTHSNKIFVYVDVPIGVK